MSNDKGTLYQKFDIPGMGKGINMALPSSVSISAHQAAEYAIWMLHEQAHGGPYQACREEPCRHIPLPYARGPAPATLPHPRGY